MRKAYLTRGFTIIEILVVVGVIMILFSLGISSFSKTAQRQFILFREKNKIVSALDKAKYLALSTFGQEQAPCGYGVYFDASNNTITIFMEQPNFSRLGVFNNPGGDCANIDYIYTLGSNDKAVETIQLDQAVEFNNNSLKNVVFIPPAPQVIITTINGDQNVQLASAEIIDSGRTAALSVTITKTGQITTESGLTPTRNETGGGNEGGGGGGPSPFFPWQNNNGDQSIFNIISQ